MIDWSQSYNFDNATVFFDGSQSGSPSVVSGPGVGGSGVGSAGVGKGSVSKP